jgi:acyl-CoA synthetase (AMP-forming)/AMP-acid ligase II
MNAVSGLLSAATAEAIPRTYNFARDIFERNNARRNRTAYIDQSGSWTYQQLRQRAESFAHVLEALQVRPEERVLMCLLDSIDWPTVFLGTLYAGRVAVPTIATCLRIAARACSSCRRSSIRNLPI